MEEYALLPGPAKPIILKLISVRTVRLAEAWGLRGGASTTKAETPDQSASLFYDNYTGNNALWQLILLNNFYCTRKKSALTIAIGSPEEKF